MKHKYLSMLRPRGTYYNENYRYTISVRYNTIVWIFNGKTISIVFPLPTRYTVRPKTTAFEYFAGGDGRYNTIIIYYINIYTPSSLYHKLRDYYIICLYTHIIIILYYSEFSVTPFECQLLLLLLRIR